MTLCRPLCSPNLRSLIFVSHLIKPFPSLSIDSWETHLPSFLNSTISSLFPRNINSLSEKSQHPEAAHQLFDGIPMRTVFHPNSLVPVFSSREREDCPKVSHIIQAITSRASDSLNCDIHAVVIKIGFECEIPVVTALIGLYSSLHDLDSAWQLFHVIPTKDLILWSAMVSACCKNGQFFLAIETFSKMHRFGFSTDHVSLLGVLPACANMGALRFGRQIHGLSIRRGFNLEASIQNSLVDMYAKCGKLNDAFLVFSCIENKDHISWKNIIFGCVSNGQPRKALSLLSNMRNSHIEADEMTVRNLISNCSRTGDLKIVHQLHCFVIKKGLLGSTSIGTTLFRVYAEFKDEDTARTLFDQLQHKDFIAWNGMVSSYSHCGSPVLALEMFREMQLAEEEANEMTLVSLLQACSLMEVQELGRSIHGHIMRKGYISNMYLESALIEFYCKIGRLRQAENLFDRIQCRDLVCWGSMIKGYGINGCGKEAIHAFSKMLEHGLLPNEIVFVSLLSACGHCGMVDEGWKWFESMEERFGINPTLAHYTCIVDMLGHHGRVEEALEFVKKMPVEPDASIWGALLRWCRIEDGDVKIAEIAAKQLIRLDPDNTSYYVALSNMYSKHGQWGDAERTRGVMEKKGLRKIAGYSLV